MKGTAYILLLILAGSGMLACAVNDTKTEPFIADSRFFPLDEGKTWHYDVEYRTSNGEEDIDTTGTWTVTQVDSSSGDSLFFSVDNFWGPSFSETGAGYMVLEDTIFAEVLTWDPEVTVYNKHLLPPAQNDTLEYSVLYSYDYSVTFRVFEEEKPFRWRGHTFSAPWVYVRKRGTGSDTLKFVPKLGFVYASSDGIIFAGEGENYNYSSKKELVDITRQ